MLINGSIGVVMSTEIISRDKDVITIQVKINLAGSMLGDRGQNDTKD